MLLNSLREKPELLFHMPNCPVCGKEVQATTMYCPKLWESPERGRFDFGNDREQYHNLCIRRKIACSAKLPCVYERVQVVGV